MTTATLVKWGNGQGVNIPKAVCDKLGLSVGDVLAVSVFDGGVTLTPTRAHKRSGRLTAEQLFEGWEGSYTPPEDFPSQGGEVIWGGPVGSEVW